MSTMVYLLLLVIVVVTHLVVAFETPFIALNFENGAHHSDLSHVGPSENDTDDIKEGFITITHIIEKWLDDIKADN